MQVVNTKDGSFYINTNKMCLINCRTKEKTKLYMHELHYYKQMVSNNKKRGHIKRRGN